MDQAEEWEAIRTRALGVSVATVTTRLFTRGLRRCAVRGVASLRPGSRLAGWAYTLRYVPSREDLDQLDVFRDPAHPQRHAVENVPAGSVLVMDARGDVDAATLGSILATRLQVRGVAGVVSDGPVRDAATIRTLQLPVFCAGAHPSTNLCLHHAVDTQVAIGCGGVLVEPGDLMVGDDDGVVVVPRKWAREVIAEAADQDDLEAYLMARVAGGAALPGTYPPSAGTLADYRAAREAVRTSSAR